ncbi:plus-3-domain-containing protein [Clavulina sp. PMI_390]|nr:plus-3-domain-containing protein [Clavulina sp. PMI_390]
MGSSDEHSDVDVDEELLELAFDVDGGDSPTGGRKRAASSSIKARHAKRRKQEMLADSDAEVDSPESEEDDANPYPLEGKYKDERDRQKLLMMPEVDREAIIASRLEEKQKLVDKMNISNFLKTHRKPQGDAVDDDAVANAAKRKHTTVGKTLEKSKALNSLAEKRRSKKERDANRDDDADYDASPRKSKRRPDDDDNSSEDGEVDSRTIDRSTDRGSDEIKLGDLMKIRLKREHLAAHVHHRWFEDLVKGAWVRYNTGPDGQGNPIYVICEITNVGADLVNAYILDGTVLSDRQIELRHAEKIKAWNMDRVSNRDFPQAEFDSLCRHLKRERMHLPRRSQVEKKAEQIREILQRPLTNADITHMLSEKKRIRPTIPLHDLVLQRNTLYQRRRLAEHSNNREEVIAIDKEIAEFEAKHPETPRGNEASDRTAVLNERNRKMAAEDRRAIDEAEREARKRKAGESSRPGTPPVKDLSARVKTMSKLLHDPNSRYVIAYGGLVSLFRQCGSQCYHN